MKGAVVIGRHRAWSRAAEHVLQRMGIEPLACADDLHAMRRLVESHDPDVLVVEVDHTTDGFLIGEVRRMRETSPALRVVGFGDEADPVALDSLFEAGMSAYCAKTGTAGDLAAAVSQSFARSLYFPAVDRASARGTQGTDGFLTKRESEILGLVVAGHSNAEVALKLFVTQQTVKFHLSNVYRKLEVSGRTEARRWAQLHLLAPNGPRGPAAA